MRWIQPALTQTSPTLAAATRAVRADERAMADSRMNDATPVELRLRRALKVLHRHKVTAITRLVLPDGQWVPFADVPVPKWESRWSALDYQALCRAIDQQYGRDARARMKLELLDGQQQLNVIRLTREQAVAQASNPSSQRHIPSRVVADRFQRIVGVSDQRITKRPGDKLVHSYMCHYAAPRHAKAQLPPEEWDDDMELGAFLCSAAASLTIVFLEPARVVQASCREAFVDANEEVQVAMRVDNTDEEFTVGVSGYRGIRAHLTPTPVGVQAQRAAERVSEEECSPAQWASFASHRARLGKVQEGQERTMQHIVHAGVDHPPSKAGQQTMHAFAQSAPSRQFGTVGYVRDSDQQSAQPWSRHQRPSTVGNIQVDLSTMLPTPACPAQGSWTATSRHGQSIIRQHPLPYSKHPHRVRPSERDLTLDTAQLRALLDRGATLADVHAASERALTTDAEEWAKILTSSLSVATGATTLWGCTGLTWDPQFPHYVSPHAEDKALGATDFETALLHVGRNSVILLDAFNAEQRRRILMQLSITRHTEWVVFSEKARIQSPSRSLLSKVGQEVETMVVGQLGAAQQAAWSTGDTRLAKISSGTSVWVGGTGAHVDSEAWEDCWTLADKHQPALSRLSAQGQEYWKRRQAGAYATWQGVVAACDGSVQGEMGAGAVVREADGSFTPHMVKVGGDPSSFRAEAAAMHLAITAADPTAPLVVLTDSMNVLQALQLWDHADFARDMRWQRNADIIMAILLAINQRAATITLVKVKSHRGVELNEVADQLAGQAVDEEASDTVFTPPPQTRA